jgi:hypothetical protein
MCKQVLNPHINDNVLATFDGTSAWHRPRRVQYVPLSINRLQEIEITLTDENGDDLFMNDSEFVINLFVR